jgi:hypothetical protein
MKEIPKNAKCSRPKQFVALSLEARNHVARTAICLPILIEARVRVVWVERTLPRGEHRDAARNLI